MQTAYRYEVVRVEHIYNPEQLQLQSNSNANYNSIFFYFFFTFFPLQSTLLTWIIAKYDTSS